VEKQNIKISPKSNLKGEITAPGDKSISHRSAIIGSIAKGITEINGFLHGEDCIATINAFRKMGVDIQETGDGKVIVHGVGLDGLKEPDDILDMGNSGTSMRLISGILAGQPFYSVLTGDNSLRSRPMKRVADPLRLMGAKIYARNGDLAPLTILGGNLKAIDYQTPVASAQIKSSILLAGLYADGEIFVTETAESRDHTERMLRSFGAEVTSIGLTHKVQGRPELVGHEINVPGDISSAAYFIVVGLLCPNSEITIKNVGINPTRTGIIDALKAMGGNIVIENIREKDEPVADLIVRSSQLKGAKFSGEIIVRMIDEIPILVLAATQANGETIINDAGELKVKESDRIATTVTEFRKIGAELDGLDDGFVITGKSKIKGGECESHGDHRLAMSLAIAGLISESGTGIDDIECVNTSFPEFWEMLNSL
jgi:3-phosphoshikimate 1-carboxyvinyltransferase